MTRAIDETVLTAYALGECTPEEATEVEALLRRSPSARDMVEQLRELAALAEEALLEEPELHDDQRQRILDAAEARDRLEAPVLPPVATPVPLPPPEREEPQVVELPEKPRSRRRIWALRVTALGAVAAVFLGGAFVSMVSVRMNAPSVSKLSSSASYGPPTSTASDGDELSSLMSELEPYPSGQASPGHGAAEWRGLDGNSARDRAASSGNIDPITGMKTYDKPRYRLIQVGGDDFGVQKERREKEAAERMGEVAATEQYNPISHNDYELVTDEPLSTFSIDVDTASYSNVRRFLEHHTLPPASAVRIEELINYFDYGYAPPVGDAPFATHVEIASCPWQPEHRLARIGIKGQVIDEGELPPSNLVFLLDVSGSMSAQNKLPLLQQAIRLLVHELDERDRVSIVVYAGSSGLVLPATSGEDDGAILKALGRLSAGGSTAGGAGIQLAYETATAICIEGGGNRVIFATDGDFNVGETDQGELLELIEDRAKSGVFLTVLGFGMGNIQDGTLEQLADHGNGNYAYIDDLDEARKVLVTERGGTMVTIAKDVKIQVEFNPMEVHAYRLIGYENRSLAARDFDDDTKDAGEIGAGHTVTALYEVVPAGTDLAVHGSPILKYQKPQNTTEAAASGELMTVKLRYKQPDAQRSELLSFGVTDGGIAWEHASEDFRHAAGVAAFGMLLRDSPHSGQASWAMVQHLARGGAARDPHGYRAEFRALVSRALELSGE